MADIWPKERRKTTYGTKADKPKRYEPLDRLQESGARCGTFVASGHPQPPVPRQRPRMLPGVLSADPGSANMSLGGVRAATPVGTPETDAASVSRRRRCPTM